MEIVIGFQGKEHITASQVGRIIAGMSGDGTYVLDTQNKLAATMQTANQVRIDTGDLVMHGRVATVETPETLTVESGVTGQKRNDLVVARYTKVASSSVESIELVVVKGTPVSYGDPTDPQINEGSILDGDSPVDVPLWRIPIDGLAPGTPVQLFETIPSIDSLRDSVSQRVLWENSGYMMAGGTVINLPERLSDQPHGIILHWQGYTGSQTQNGNHSYQFIPKEHAVFGGGVTHIMSVSDGTILGCKYLYVTNTKIAGHENNNSSFDLGDVTFANNRWVLTQIISF